MIDVRRASLAVCVGGVLSEAIPFWYLLKNTFRFGFHWESLVIVATVVLCAAVLLLFYVALYKNAQPLRFPKPYRLVAFAAAVVLTSNLAYTMFSLVRTIYLNSASRPILTMTDVANLSPALPDITMIILLLACWRQFPSVWENQVTETEFLRRISLTAVIVYGLWVLFLLVRLAVLPIAVRQLTDLENQAGRTPPSLRSWELQGVHILFVHASYLVAPFIVWRASRAKSTQAGSISVCPKSSPV